MPDLTHSSGADVDSLSAELAALRRENAALQEGEQPSPMSRCARLVVGTTVTLLLSCTAALVVLWSMPLD